MTVQANIIYQPLSGQYTEKYFEASNKNPNTQSWTWVHFTKSNGTEWVASFRGGETDKKQLELLSETPFVFVVSDGQGYFVDVETEEVIEYTIQDTIEEMVTNSNKSLTLFADRWNIFTVDNSLEVKEVEVPFEFYFVWFEQLSEDIIKVNYEEMYTGNHKTAFLDTKTLRFILGENDE